MVNEYEPSKVGILVATESRDIQKEILELVLNIISLKIGIGESICRNKISLYEEKYLKLMNRSLDLRFALLDVKTILDELGANIDSIEERASIISRFMDVRPFIKEIIDFNLALLINIQSLLESKRRAADQIINMMIMILALSVAIIIGLYT